MYNPSNSSPSHLLPRRYTGLRRTAVRITFLVLFGLLLWGTVWFALKNHEREHGRGNRKMGLELEKGHGVLKTRKKFQTKTRPGAIKIANSTSIPHSTPRIKAPRPTLPQNDTLHRVLKTSYPTFSQSPPDVTAILPYNGNVSWTIDFLFSLHSRPTLFNQLIIASPKSSRSSVDMYLGEALRLSPVSAFLQSWEDELGDDLGLVHLAATAAVTSEWVLLLDDEGTGFLSDEVFRNPMSNMVPIGPRGATLSPSNVICLSPTDLPQAAAFLLPPFMIRTSILRDAEIGLSIKSNGAGVWSSLGQMIFQGNGRGMGGIVAGVNEPTSLDWCGIAHSETSSRNGTAHTVDESLYHALLKAQTTAPVEVGVFGVILPSMNDIDAFKPTLCRLARQGNSIRVLILSEQLAVSQKPHSGTNHCHLHHDLILPSNSSNALNDITHWILELDRHVEVFVHIANINSTYMVDSAIETASARYSDRPTIVRFTNSDLEHVEWAGTLTIREWKSVDGHCNTETIFLTHRLFPTDWHTPRIDIAVIANDRPNSLDRLLKSLNSSLYFGDRLNLHVSLEQTADTQTRRLIEEFEWRAGDVTVRHRIILGGLMSAVVESWFPHSNDSYGVILEDDIEVSPLFYAWIKMAVLRYRYTLCHPSKTNVADYLPLKVRSRTQPIIAHIWGQPLSAESLGAPTRRTTTIFRAKCFGRRARVPEHSLLFAGYAFFHFYYVILFLISPMHAVPCSWGAAFFPEHWKEFHDYLSIRLSESTHDISEVIIPDIRSNRWARSWKKFFNELVFLRGYVMLYPNYNDYLSLSTNHLEVGSHVQALSDAELAKRRAQFELPLMPLNQESAINGETEDTILDIPFSTMPDLEDIPVIDLWGRVSSHEEIVRRGADRHDQVSGCPSMNLATANHDAQALLCSPENDSAGEYAPDEEIGEEMAIED
jgi:hypothetical protein